MVSARDGQVAGSHYRRFRIQPWDIVDEYGLSFYGGSALKYLLRAGRKGPKIEDLRKARHYLDKMIELEVAMREQEEPNDENIVLNEELDDETLRGDGE